MGREALRTRFVRTEPTAYIQSEQSRIDHRKNSTLKRESAEIDEHYSLLKREWQLLPPENINISLYQTQGEIPSGLVICVTQDVGAFMLLKKLGHIHANGIDPDVLLEGTLEEMVEAMEL
jgi:hypothetical protein